jgi:hypothetical protein
METEVWCFGTTAAMRSLVRMLFLQVAGPDDGRQGTLAQIF